MLTEVVSMKQLSEKEKQEQTGSLMNRINLLARKLAERADRIVWNENGVANDASGKLPGSFVCHVTLNGTADAHVRKWLVLHNGRYWNVEEYMLLKGKTRSAKGGDPVSRRSDPASERSDPVSSLRGSDPRIGLRDATSAHLRCGDPTVTDCSHPHPSLSDQV